MLWGALTPFLCGRRKPLLGWVAPHENFYHFRAFKKPVWCVPHSSSADFEFSPQWRCESFRDDLWFKATHSTDSGWTLSILLAHRTEKKYSVEEDPSDESEERSISITSRSSINQNRPNAERDNETLFFVSLISCDISSAER